VKQHHQQQQQQQQLKQPEWSYSQLLHLQDSAHNVLQ
jgi:hypothetical protein